LKESIYAPIYKKGDKRDCNNYRGILLLPTTYNFFLPNILLSRITPCAEEIIGYHQCGYYAAGQLLIMYSAFVEYLRENGNKWKKCISYSWT
jgi:hypothetical protein